jgi:hypothetical protein
VDVCRGGVCIALELSKVDEKGSLLKDVVGEVKVEVQVSCLFGRNEGRMTIARASGRTVVEEGVSAVLENRQAGRFTRGLLECKAIDSFRRASALLDMPFLEASYGSFVMFS